MPRLIVTPNHLGTWYVFRDDNSVPAAEMTSRAGALAWVRSSAPAGSAVAVLDRQGQVVEQFVLPGSTSSPAAGTSSQPAAGPPPPGPDATAAPPAPGLAAEVESQGEQWDKFIDIAGPIAVAGGSAWISPAVADAGGWFGVFIATFVWSAGCALATYFIKAHKLEGPNMAGAVSASLIAALVIGALTGAATLDVATPFAEGGGHPLIRIPLAFFFAAVQTYGLFGALLGGGIGIWLGVRFAKRFPQAY